MDAELALTRHECELLWKLLDALKLLDVQTALALLDAWPALPSAS